MPTGTVKRLVRDRGFGFILPEDKNAEELFFHRSAVTGGSFEALDEGQKVSFDAGNGAKGPRAESVRAI